MILKPLLLLALISALTISLWPSSASAEVLTLAECLAIAEANHPSLRSAAADVSADIAALRSAAAASRITVDGSVSTGRSGSDKGESSSFSAGASASLLLFDSGRTHYRILSSRRGLDASRESAIQTLRSVRSEVKTAYTTLLYYMETVAAREASVRANELHLAQARGGYEAGSRALYDVTQAEADLGSARLSLVEARSQVVAGRAALLSAMGVTSAGEFDVEPVGWDLEMELDAQDASPSYWELPRGAEEDAIAVALENRADHAALAHRVEASRASLGAASRSASPSISLSGGYDGSGSHIGNLSDGWSTRVSLSIPIIDGGSAAADEERSRAALASAEASLEKSRQDIVLSVRRALNDLRTARERIALASISVRNAEENYRLASGRYEAGVGTSLEVSDALSKLTDARLASAQAYNRLESAIISFEDALGVELTFPDEEAR